MSGPETLDDAARLIGVWSFDEGYQVTELLFRSDYRYQRDTRSAGGANLEYASSERGRYEIANSTLTFVPYEYYGEPGRKAFTYRIDGETLSLTRAEYEYTEVYRLQPGSPAQVREREQVPRDLVGIWTRPIAFYGAAAYTFRPDGYYVLENAPADPQFPPEFIRGRYDYDGSRLTLRPYSGVALEYEPDFFGGTLALLRQDASSGEVAVYDARPGSSDDVRARTAEAAAFVAGEHWHVGVWEIRDAIHVVDVTLRPDGRYIAREDTQYLEGIVRGRYVLEPGRIRLSPFAGQDLYARSNGEFGKVERTRALDYYDGELQIIDLEAISQSVTIARKRPGSAEKVLEQVREAEQERQVHGWHVGIWEVNDPAGWMELTFRPDDRYIMMAGAERVPGQVERGRLRMTDDKVTLAPYPNLGAARGFELDLYDGDLFLIGDLRRLVVARKVPGSAAAVADRTERPESMRGERGGILGRWSAPLPGQSAELVFRPDGEFRLERCLGSALSRDYGLYTVDMGARTVVYNSRFVEIQTLGLDFYGDTMTLFGGSSPPSTYVVNLGTVDAAIERSLAHDAEERQVDAQWLARVPVAPRDPAAVQTPAGDIPADPHPTRTFDDPMVLATFQLYRRLTPGFVYFNDQGSIKAVPIVNTSEWYFFPTGRALVRFRNHHAGFPYPNTTVDVSDSWGAYRIDPKPEGRDVVHIYADNALLIDSDSGERAETTLEDGRRHLFWGKTYQIQSEWAAEQRPTPCQDPPAGDLRLLNTGVALSTPIPPDDVELRG